MSEISIRGSAEVIRGLDDIPELIIDRETATQKGDGWRVFARATDAAIAAIQARGATVFVTMTEEELQENLANALAQVVRTPDGGGG